MSSYIEKLKGKQVALRPDPESLNKFKPFQNERDSLGRLLRKSGGIFKRKRTRRSPLVEKYKKVVESSPKNNMSKFKDSELESINPGSPEFKMSNIFRKDYILSKSYKTL